MNDRDHPLSDSELRDRILGGLGAFKELQTRFRRSLELDLLGQCNAADGRSREKSVEIASEVLADCFVKSPSLLEKWRGEDHLEAFLRTAARNRLKSWWRSRDATTEVNSESHAITDAPDGRTPAAVDWDELKAAERALEAGVEAAASECPEGLVFMRLKGLFGVNQRVLSALWEHHEAQTSRRIKEAMELIRTRAQSVAAAAGIDVDFETLRTVLQGKPSILFGGAAVALGEPDIDLLGFVAAGRGGDAERGRAVSMMARNLQALECFARLLNHAGGFGSRQGMDPGLDDAAARLTESVRRSFETLNPAEVRELVSPLVSGLFGDCLEWIAADGGTLWWLSPGDAVLEAVFNPLEPEMAGHRQPLVSGIISMALAISETICVENMVSDPRHSPAIDSALGKTTRSMIAVPLRLSENTHGVLTAVRLGDASPFGIRETAVMERQARTMTALLEMDIVARLTGRHR